MHAMQSASVHDHWIIRPWKREVKDFTVVRAYVQVGDSQHPNWPTLLFREWVDSGWNVESVMLKSAPDGSFYECYALGVLSKERDAKTVSPAS